MHKRNGMHERRWKCRLYDGRARSVAKETQETRVALSANETRDTRSPEVIATADLSRVGRGRSRVCNHAGGRGGGEEGGRQRRFFLWEEDWEAVLRDVSAAAWIKPDGAEADMKAGRD